MCIRDRVGIEVDGVVVGVNVGVGVCVDDWPDDAVVAVFVDTAVDGDVDPLVVDVAVVDGDVGGVTGVEGVVAGTFNQYDGLDVFTTGLLPVEGVDWLVVEAVDLSLIHI